MWNKAQYVYVYAYTHTKPQNILHLRIRFKTVTANGINYLLYMFFLQPTPRRKGLKAGMEGMSLVRVHCNSLFSP